MALELLNDPCVSRGLRPTFQTVVAESIITDNLIAENIPVAFIWYSGKTTATNKYQIAIPPTGRESGPASTFASLATAIPLAPTDYVAADCNAGAVVVLPPASRLTIYDNSGSALVDLANVTDKPLAQTTINAGLNLASAASYTYRLRGAQSYA